MYTFIYLNRSKCLHLIRIAIEEITVYQTLLLLLYTKFTEIRNEKENTNTKVSIKRSVNIENETDMAQQGNDKGQIKDKR